MASGLNGKEMMHEQTTIEIMVDDVKGSRLSRRDFTSNLLGLGVAAPIAWQILDYRDAG